MKSVILLTLHRWWEGSFVWHVQAGTDLVFGDVTDYEIQCLYRGKSNSPPIIDMWRNISLSYATPILKLSIAAATTDNYFK